MCNERAAGDHGDGSGRAGPTIVTGGRAGYSTLVGHAVGGFIYCFIIYPLYYVLYVPLHGVTAHFLPTR